MITKLEEPIYINRFVTGLWTQRSPLVSPESFNGLSRVSRLDALFDGLNVEVSPQGTIIRRPGLSKWNPNQLGASEVPRNAISVIHSNGALQVYFDLTTSIKRADSTTNLSDPAILINSTLTGGQVFFQNVRDVVYYANGTIAKKYNALAFQEQNWGIAYPVTAPTVTVLAGSLSPTAGYQWVYVYRNSATGHISSASPASANPGPGTSKKYTIQGANTSDPQVTHVDIYRTEDGGSTFFWLATIPYVTSWSYTDNLDDLNLDTTNAAPIDHENDPPPTGISKIVFHMGRMWGAVGNLVYFATGPDALQGVPEEAWSPLNYFIFPSEVQKLVATNFGLLVFLRDDLYLIRGVDAASFYGSKYLANLGIANPNAVTTDGTNLYIYTSQGQLMRLTQEKMDEIGFPVADILINNFPPASTRITILRKGNESALYMSNGTDKMMKYSLAMDNWSSVASPSGGVGWVQALETSVGLYNLLAGRTTGSGYILKRDATVSQDDGSNFSAYATFGGYVVAKPGSLVDVKSVLLQSNVAGTAPIISVLVNETSGAFTTLTSVNEPPQLSASSTLTSKRFYIETASTPLSTLMQLLQIKVDFGTQNAASELYGLGIAS